VAQQQIGDVLSFDWQEKRHGMAVRFVPEKGDNEHLHHAPWMTLF